MAIIGYKCFNNDMTNRYGRLMKIGKKYSINGGIKFGNNGNGFHLCERLEDTLRYFDAMDNTVSICLVKGSGQMVSYNDEYYGYYDMYAVATLEILKKLTRDEIIKVGIELDEIRVKRFISSYKLTLEEIRMFKHKFNQYMSVMEAIEYYQENQLDAYVKKRGSYGRNYNKRC